MCSIDWNHLELETDSEGDGMGWGRCWLRNEVTGDRTVTLPLMAWSSHRVFSTLQLINEKGYSWRK